MEIDQKTNGVGCNTNLQGRGSLGTVENEDDGARSPEINQ